MKQTFYETEPLDDDWIYGRTAFNRGIPWVVPSAFSFLEASFRPDWKVFEWGVGGSTVWFAQNCSEVVTIEVDPNWKTRVEEVLAERGLEEKAVILHISIFEYESEYFDRILIFPDESLDLVFVDGDRGSRNACIDISLKKIKRGGWLLVDNTNWSDETPSLLNIAHWDTFEFVALPFEWLDVPSEWSTTLYRKPEFEFNRTEWLRFFVPQMFLEPGSLLYVGASRHRQECLHELMNAGNDVTILEIWPDNVSFLKEHGFNVIEGDVRKAAKFFDESFDYALWWHGPEHIERSSLDSTLKGLESISNLTVISCPWGRNEQGEYNGNPHEAHVSILDECDFAGYETACFGMKDRPPYSIVIAWKQES